MRKTTKQRYVGMRIMTDDKEADELVQEFMRSDAPNRLYTRPGELTNAFKSASKKKRSKNDEANKKSEQQADDSSDDYYSDSDKNDVFDMNDYIAEMERLGVYNVEELQSRGCNHSTTCPVECRLYHDTQRPSRRHYYNGEDGSTEFEKSRYGRFVRDPGTTNMIRLADDGEEEAFREIDALYEHGWHHASTCPSTCVRYHHPGLPERYIRLSGGVFREAPDGPWMREWVNGEMAYIRIGPNDAVSPPPTTTTTTTTTTIAKKLTVSPPPMRPTQSVITTNTTATTTTTKTQAFVEMSHEQIIAALRGPLGIEQDMAIREIARLITPLQQPIDNGPTVVSIVAAGGASDTEKRSVYDAMCRLFRTHECCIVIDYPIADEEKSDEEMRTLFSKSMLAMRAKQQSLPLDADDQCIIVLIDLGDISTHKSIEALERLDSLLSDEERLPLAEDVAVVLYATSHYGEKLLDVARHTTLLLALEAIDDDIGLGCAAIPAHVVPFFRVKPDAKTLVRSLLAMYQKRGFTAHGVDLLFAERELKKLIRYIVESALAIDTTTDERRIRQLVHQAVENTMECMTLYMKALEDDHDDIDLNTSISPILGVRIIERPSETRNPCVAKLRRKPAYKSLVQQCIDNKWDMPCVVLTWDTHLLQHIHVVEPVEKSLSVTTKRKRDETDDASESATNEKKKKKTKKSRKEIIKHKWIVDTEISNRKSTVYVCQCSLAPTKHYRRQCSAGDDQCHGDGFKGGVSRGYCAECLKHRTNK